MNGAYDTQRGGSSQLLIPIAAHEHITTWSGSSPSLQHFILHVYVCKYIYIVCYTNLKFKNLPSEFSMKSLKLFHRQLPALVFAKEVLNQSIVHRTCHNKGHSHKQSPCMYHRINENCKQEVRPIVVCYNLESVTSVICRITLLNTLLAGSKPVCAYIYTTLHYRDLQHFQ